MNRRNTLHDGRTFSLSHRMGEGRGEGKSGSGAAYPAVRSVCSLHRQAAGIAFVCLLLLSTGCSRSRKEPPIKGKASDPAVSLRYAWKPGFRYHLKFEMEEVTDSSAAADPNEAGIHRVTVAQECMVTATNLRRGDNVGLDMEILSLAMERAKGTAVALSFDSEQGGEASDDYGYIPALQSLVGGHLQFQISPDGRMLRAAGIPEWLARAVGDPPARPPGP